MKQQHMVTNKGDSEIKVHMEDGWHTVQPSGCVTGVLWAVNNGRMRTLYSVEPFGDGQLASPEPGKGSE